MKNTRKVCAIILAAVFAVCTATVSGSCSEIVTVTPVIVIGQDDVKGCLSGESVLDTAINNLKEHGAHAAFAFDLSDIAYTSDLTSALVKIKAGNHMLLRFAYGEEQLGLFDLTVRYILGEVPCLVYGMPQTYTGVYKVIETYTEIDIPEQVEQIAKNGVNGLFIRVNTEILKETLTNMDKNDIVCTVMPDVMLAQNVLYG